ncbi:MAG: DUF1883 domain-containing protein [Magnetospirillum sp.]|nr:DUF1883 domain-containing protein [Magnetospirillum sp.]
MQFIHHDLGYCQQGDVAEITLSGSAANVMLFDSSDFSNYRSGRPFNYRGGLAQRSPVRLAIPSSGNWHVAVDMRGLRGNVKSAARVIRAAALRPLPPMQEAPLSSIPSLLRRPDPSSTPPGAVTADDREYDVFISHASEDKEEVVRPLAHALANAGLRVWYDEFELRIGDSLRRKIDRGLASSRFGVIVMSASFFTKGWTNYELDGLVTRANTGEQVLLPIWHNVTKKQVIEYSPSLADRLARNTSTHTVEEIAAEIAEVIQAGP